MPSLNVLTINTHMGFSLLNRRFVLPELREAITGVAADVVFLQEVLGADERHAKRHSNWPQGTHYDYLAHEVWPHSAYGQNAVYPHGHHGNALLSKHRIVRHDNRDVSVRGHENRGLLHCVLEVPGCTQEVHTVCVHLGLLESHRQRQIALLCELVCSELPPDAAVIVAGDFNDWRLRGHPAVRACGLLEAFEEVTGALPRTFPARYPTLRLDRIYLRNARAVAVEALHVRPWSHLSDHSPLLARIEV